MSDPVKALREFVARDNVERLFVASVLRRERDAAAKDDNPEAALPLALARALLSAAPALLARLEAGEGLLREARNWMVSLGALTRPSKALLKDIDAIDAFLAAKDVNRG